MEFKMAMELLAQRTGVKGGFPEDKDGVVMMHVDDVLHLALKEIPSDRSAVMWCLLHEVPAVGAEQLFRTLLRENNFGRTTASGTLSLTEDDKICLHSVIPLAGMDFDGFLIRFERFIEAALNWIDILDVYQPEKASEAALLDDNKILV